jgi:luciferase family oxidoreductase group 1
VSLRLGILDQSPVVAGSDPERAIAATIALVRRAEVLGYHRYWFAEHHGREHAFASGAPELMIARLAAETSRIRLGSGGVLLSHYSPLKVAESFRLLEAFAPNRIDLGIGGGTGADEETERALAGATTHAVSYPQRVGELLTFLGDGFPTGHPFRHVAVTPVIGRMPEPWMLGSTRRGAALAAEFGIPFAYAHFIKGDGTDVTSLYRSTYRPSARFPQPRVLLTVAAYCSPDAEERDDFITTLRVRRARMYLERDPRPPTPEEARHYSAGAEARRHMQDTTRIAILGSPSDMRARLHDVADRHGAEDVLIITVAPDYASRSRSYEAIASACA